MVAPHEIKKELTREVKSGRIPEPGKMARDLRVAEMYQDGMSHAKIAKATGLSEPTIAKILRGDNAVRFFINTAARIAATMLPKATQNYQEFLDDPEDKQLRLAASRDVMKNTGITPSNNVNVNLTQITQTNNIVANPEALEILRKVLAPTSTIPGLPDPNTDVLDAEYTEDADE